MEEERERRRMRDRQRRQSMSFEQRERHLARRRRNYQLRRLRSNPQDPRDETVITNEDYDGFEKLNSIILESASQETSVGTAKTVRLSRIRCLARSLSFSEEGSLVNVTDFNSQIGESDVSSRLLGGVRLNRIKRLARGLSSSVNEANNVEVQQEQDLPRPVVTSPMLGQETIAGNEDRTTL